MANHSKKKLGTLFLIDKNYVVIVMTILYFKKYQYWRIFIKKQDKGF